MTGVGKTIRMLRHKHGWSQRDVAEQLDISIPAFSKIESGATDVNLSRLDQIAALFNLSVIGLLADGGNYPDIQLSHQVKNLNKRLLAREDEVIVLQEKIIRLFEELRHNKADD